MKISDWKTMRHQALLWLEAGLIKDTEYQGIVDGIETRLIALRPAPRQRLAFTARLLLRGGVSLVIAGLIYFIAANWRGFPRGYKIVLLLIGLVATYAGGGYYLLKEHADRAMGGLLIIAGSWLFGISLALVGQTYNSHADSWQLFGVWALPCIALSFLLRSHYFAVKSLLLFNLGVWLFLFPGSRFGHPLENLRLGILLISILNGLLFAAISLTPRDWTRAARYVAYLAMLGFLFTLTLIGIGSGGTSGGWNLFFAIGLVAAVVYYIEIRLDEWLVYMTLIVGAVWTLVKFLEWAFPSAGDNLFISLIFFGACWLGVNAFVFSWINRRIGRRKVGA
jgi:uncharacterized membrane protein